MRAYGFKSVFAGQLAAGEKTITLRRTRTSTQRHATVGEPIGLWTGLRTKEATRRGVGLVVVRALVRIREGGPREISDLTVRDAADDYVQALLADLQAPDAFARRDGFENWASAWSWHDAARAQAERGDRALVRELIGWRPLTTEQIAALENGSGRLDEVA